MISICRSAGLVEEGRDTISRDLGDGAILLFHLTSEGRLAAASAVGRLGRIAREVRLAEMLIVKRARARSVGGWLSADVKLKSLLAA